MAGINSGLFIGVSMSRYYTYDPVPSNAMRDLSDNAIIVDELVHKKTPTTPDRFGILLITWFGLVKEFRDSLTKIGYITTDSFQDGARLELSNQVLRWKLPDGDGDYYRWDGAFPKDVPVNSTPLSAGGVGKGAWVSVGDAALRSQLASFDGTSFIGLPYGTLSDAMHFLTPEMFMHHSEVVVTQAIQLCADAAKALNLPVFASGTYDLTESVEFDGIRWRGGVFRVASDDRSTAVRLVGADVEGATFECCYVHITKSGNTRFYKNKLHGQRFTAAVFIRAFDQDGSVDICFNEFWDCNYAILQQGTSTATVRSGRISFNHIHDIYGDGIELNVVNMHYPDGLVIEGNIISNVDSINANNGNHGAWGIGIGIAGKPPYGLDSDVPDSQYVAKFTIRNNHITKCRQCIHVELGRDFVIENNYCWPDTAVSGDSGLYFAAIAIYGCKRFTIDGVTGEPVGTANRYVLIEWGVNNGTTYAGPPRDFTLRNINTYTGDIEVATAGGVKWTNTTILENSRCRILKWRGLPTSSIYRNIYANKIDYIGVHDSTEGSGGGVYTTPFYTYTNWSNVICLTATDADNLVFATQVSFSKIYTDRIDQSGNNFEVPTEMPVPGNRGPQLYSVVEQYLLDDDQMAGGREFSKGTVLWKASGGYFLITTAGAFISQNGDYADKIRHTEAGQSYIAAMNKDWSQGVGAKAAGTRLVIPGAGKGGTDLTTTIIRGGHIIDNNYRCDIDPPIVTATEDGVVIRALYPCEYVET
jgi:hypothetical protein